MWFPENTNADESWIDRRVASTQVEGGGNLHLCHPNETKILSSACNL